SEEHQLAGEPHNGSHGGQIGSPWCLWLGSVECGCGCHIRYYVDADSPPRPHPCNGHVSVSDNLAGTVGRCPRRPRGKTWCRTWSSAARYDSKDRLLESLLGTTTR